MTLATGDTTIKLSELTPCWLKDNYLTGLRFVDEHGRDRPDSFYETHMQNAVRTIEKLCDISILAASVTRETHDYHVNDYAQWGWLQLYKVPVKVVHKVCGRYPLGESVVEYPTEWIDLKASAGQISLVPSRGSLGSVLIMNGGSFLPLHYSGMERIPSLWEVDYEAGMDPEDMPRDVVDAIAKLACINLLTIMSNLVRPVGVSSESVSIDGLSQSMSYQMPAFQAHISQYSESLYGPAGKSQDIASTSGLLKQIYDFYKPVNMVSG